MNAHTTSNNGLDYIAVVINPDQQYSETDLDNNVKTMMVTAE